MPTLGSAPCTNQLVSPDVQPVHRGDPSGRHPLKIGNLHAVNMLSPVGQSIQDHHNDGQKWKLYEETGKKERRNPVRHRYTPVGSPWDSAFLETWLTEFWRLQTRQGEQNITGYMTGLVNDLLYGVNKLTLLTLSRTRDFSLMCDIPVCPHRLPAEWREDRQHVSNAKAQAPCPARHARYIAGNE